MTNVVAQIEAAGGRYTPSERRVADYVLQSYPAIMFETVASVAANSGTSPPTVMRFAAKAGFSGFTELQERAQEVVDGDWTPILSRLGRGPTAGPRSWLERGVEAEVDNVRRTLTGIPTGTFDEIADLLADDRRSVYVVGGEITHGICLSFAALLRWLRDDVHVLGAAPAALGTDLLPLDARSVVLAVVLRRRTSTLRAVLQTACSAGATVIVATNSPTLPLPEGVRHVLRLHMRGAGRLLDSYAVVAALTNTLAAAVADRRRSHLEERMSRLERRWRDLGVYVE